MANESETRALVVTVLRTIAMNDRTTYEHHEKRPRDGRRPEADGGTIFLTPRELALRALSRLGEETDSLYFPFAPAAPSRPVPGKEP